MQAGKLKDRVELLIPSGYTQAPSGQQTTLYTPLCSRYAHVVESRAEESEQGGQIKGKRTADFTIRYDWTLEAFGATGQVRARGRVWNLTGPPLRSDDGSSLHFSAVAGEAREFFVQGGGSISLSGFATVSVQQGG